MNIPSYDTQEKRLTVQKATPLDLSALELLALLNLLLVAPELAGDDLDLALDLLHERRLVLSLVLGTFGVCGRARMRVSVGRLGLAVRRVERSTLSL